MKASGSPCPLDQISIIVFKKCPYLRPLIHAVITKVLITNQIPETWKRAVTILVYKEGDEPEPQNLRPITLETVPLKIFLSFPRNRIYEFLKDNNYIESEIQKGFVPKMSGTFEHTYHLTHLISHARKKQRFLTVTLLDLRNAFGEVHHNLIKTVLEYHHLPTDTNTLIQQLYTNFFTCITTDSVRTDFIHVGLGVLQGDCLSPLYST